MSSATRPSPMMASMKDVQLWTPPDGAANPSVVTEEPLISKERSRVSASIPQNSREKPTITVSIQTRGRLIRATGP